MTHSSDHVIDSHNLEQDAGEQAVAAFSHPTSVPQVPLQQALKTQARAATRAKLKSLGLEVALQRARRFLATKNAFDWPMRVFIVLAIGGSLGTHAGLISPALVLRFVGIYALTGLSLFLLVRAGQKLGLINPTFGKEKTNTGLGDFVYTHQKPETSIEEPVIRAEAPAKPAEPLAPIAHVEQAKASDWQVVEIKNLGKIRFHVVEPDVHLDAHQDQPRRD
jgi:hypothetical protein